METAAPRALRDPAALAARLRRASTAAHVRSLNAWALDLAERLDRPGAVPLFDPASGGVRARVLCLLESPGQKAVHVKLGLDKPGTGLISADNDDPTAENFWRAREQAGLDYRELVLWNVVPWYAGTLQQNATPSAADLRAARPLLSELIALLPRLVTVVPMGRMAQRQWAGFLAQRPCNLVTVPTYHPSPRSLATGGHRQQLELALRRVRALLDVQ